MAVSFEIVQDYSKFREIFKASKLVFFDTETTGLEVGWKGKVEMTGITFSFDDNDKVFYLPFRHKNLKAFSLEGRKVEFENPTTKLPLTFFKQLGSNTEIFQREEGKEYKNLLEEELRDLLDIMEEGTRTYVAHNFGYDSLVNCNEGMDLDKFFKNTINDTAIMAFVINQDLELKEEKLVRNLLDVEKCEFKHCLATALKSEKEEYGVNKEYPLNFSMIPVVIGAYYSGGDVVYMKMLYKVIMGALDSGESIYPDVKEYYDNFKMPLAKTVVKMQRRGFKIDIPALHLMADKASFEIKKFEGKIYKEVGIQFNINSSQQKNALFFGALTYRKKKDASGKMVYVDNRENEVIQSLIKINLGLKPSEYTETTKNFPKDKRVPKAGKDEMEKLYAQCKTERQTSILTIFQKYTTLSKLHKTFMIGLEKQIYSDGKVHCDFNVCGTTSGRLSASKPNLQNQPRPKEDDADGFEFWEQFEIRKLLVADDGYTLITCDYGQLEQRIGAELSQDVNMLRVFNEGLDMHSLTATYCFPELAELPLADIKKHHHGQRAIAKTISFLMNYGGSASLLAKKLGCTKHEAEVLITRYWDAYEGLIKFFKHEIAKAKTKGYVEIGKGHIRTVPDIVSRDRGKQGYSERLVKNSIPQGKSSDLVGVCMLQVETDPELLSYGCQMINQVHDEIVCQVKIEFVEQAMARLKFIMEDAPKHEPFNFKLDFLADVNSGHSYFEAK